MLEQPDTIRIRRRVIGKFSKGNEPDPQEYANIEAYIEKKEELAWSALKDKFPGISAERMITSVEPETIVEIMAIADTDPKHKELRINLLAYFYIDYPYESVSDEEDDQYVRVLQAIASDASKLVTLERAFVQFKSASPPFPPSAFIAPNDPRYVSQSYLHDAAQGVGAAWAWNVAGGDGINMKFVAIEEGWNLNHQDLPTNILPPQAPGVNLRYFGHGTAVLGIVVAIKGNNADCVGIANASTAIVESDQEPDPAVSNQYLENIPNAITRAIAKLSIGDVILIEDQLSYASNNFPVEIQSDILDFILTATAAGRIVIEPAGNSGVDITFLSSTLPSGAIMVGSCTRGNNNEPHERTPPVALQGPSSDPMAPGPASNFGSRIDCFAWGEAVTTCGDGQNGTLANDFTDYFGGTSSASAIITGVALVIQSLAKTHLLRTLSTSEMRSLLSNPAHGTPVYTPSAFSAARYKIVEGYMPDLQKILTAYFGIP